MRIHDGILYINSNTTPVQACLPLLRVVIRNVNQVFEGADDEVFESDYVNGAVYDECSDVWYPMQWDWNGNYASKPSAADLINVK